MSKRTVPARLLELATRWISPYRIESVFNEQAAMIGFREQSRKARTEQYRFGKVVEYKPAPRGRRRLSPEEAEKRRSNALELVAMLDKQISHADQFAAQAEKILKAQLEELEEYRALLREHAPELAHLLPKSLRKPVDGYVIRFEELHERLLQRDTEALPEKQRMILDTLTGRALALKALSKAVDPDSTDTSRFHRDHLKPLMVLGRIKNDRKVGGYYRPDAPPK